MKPLVFGVFFWLQRQRKRERWIFTVKMKWLKVFMASALWTLSAYLVRNGIYDIARLTVQMHAMHFNASAKNYLTNIFVALHFNELRSTMITETISKKKQRRKSK